MRNLYKKIAIAFSAIALVFSCEEDDLTGQSNLVIANPTMNVALDFAPDQTFVEEELSFGFTATISEPQVVNVPVFLELDPSSTASEGDDISFPHSLTIPIGSTSVSDVITVHRDLEAEDTETAIIQIGTGNEPNVASVSGATATFTLQDFVFCTWTIVTSDTYGDGWNGGFIDAVIDGVSTHYAAAGAGSTFELSVPEGVDYSFTYVSGGGSGGGPGWESENYYKITAPDGTEFEDGTMDYSGIPTPGLITSGTNICP